MAAFDDSAPGTHREDFQLLQNGHLHLVRHEWALARLLEDLTTLAYSIAAADVGACDNATQVRQCIIAAVPESPAGYGANNWDAFNDGLTDYLSTAAYPNRVLVLQGFDDCRRRDPNTTEVLIDELARIGR